MGHRSVTSTRRRLGGTAIGVGGAAFAVIQILQQTVGAFDPRPVVSLLLAVTIGLGGLALQRARHRAARSGVLRRLMRVWPLRRIGDTDPLALGVFPPPDAVRGSGLGPYVARGADAAVREAIGAGGLVVLVGPDRAGKSRTACEMARSVAGGRMAVVPVGGAALAALVDDPSFTPPADAVWWLDDLERFEAHLDGPQLATLLDGRTVVTTVRPQAWEALLRGSGDAGERGRRLAAAARVVVLPSAASAAEAERARELYPDALDLSGGLGATLGALPAPSSTVAPALDGEREPEPAADRVLVLGLGATAASALVLAVAVLTGGWAEAVAPPVSAQLAKIRQAAQRAGDATTSSAVQDLHGVRSHVFVLAPSDGSRNPELRIYDEEDGWLRLRFRFRPGYREAPEGTTLAADYRNGAELYGLQRPGVLDVDRDGHSELLATYETFLPEGMFPAALLAIKVPVVVAWDDSAQRYAISPALPAVQPHFAGELAPFFAGPYALADPQAGITLRAGAASELLADPAIRVRGSQSLLAARAIDGSSPRRLAVTTYAMGVVRGRVESTLGCTSQAGVVRIVRTGRRSLQRVLRDVAPGFARDVIGGSDDRGRSCV